jgi:hypothetical protein
MWQLGLSRWRIAGAHCARCQCNVDTLYVDTECRCFCTRAGNPRTRKLVEVQMTLMQLFDEVRERLSPRPQATECHSERLSRLAREADEATGEDLGALSPEDRRKVLFGG